MLRTAILLIALPLVPQALAAQTRHAGPGRAEAPEAASQFDFLIGAWELTVRPRVAGLAARIHGGARLSGRWKAWRGFDGWGIEDELRIMDGSGNPVSFLHTIRIYDAAAGRWTQTSIDPWRGRFSPSQAAWKSGVMQVDGSGVDQEGRPFRSRTRFFEITAAGFRFRQDRSFDEGRTWEEGVLRIEARRAGAGAER